MESAKKNKSRRNARQKEMTEVNREEIILREQRDALLREAQQITANPNATKQDLKRADVLLARASNLRSRESMQARAAVALEEVSGQRIEIETEEQRAVRLDREEERATLRKLLFGTMPEGSYELRTYSALSDTASIVAQTFVNRLALTMKASGPLYAGSPLVTNVTTGTGLTAKLPCLDDTSDGFEVSESVAESDGVFSPTNTSITLRKFSSGICLYSMELADDVMTWDSLTQILARSLGIRLGRAQNKAFLATLLTALEANSSASVPSASAGVVGYDDVVALTSGVNGAYRQNGSFLMNSSTALALSKIKTAVTTETTGLPIFPDILSPQPKLLGYDVYISDYADDVATSNHPVLFGDFSTLYCRQTEGFGIRTFKERFVDSGSFAALVRKRCSMVYSIPSTADSAIKMLTIS